MQNDEAIDQYTMQDSTKQYPAQEFEKQRQPEPGLTSKMSPKPDHGEKTYRGSGRLKGRKAIITGANSGIGRAVTIAFAREGADILLSYLPEEESDGQPQEKIPGFGAQTPLGRAGQPAELAPVFVFLASQESSYVTAEVYGVTGGQHLP